METPVAASVINRVDW